ncbi:hypothetical protein AVEN_176428-1 [Araneus ventricosus]|uniref:Uncharacterized protein n=1 Tax=Araneus ventricosus TaxID=182803 RepID=A0A4Y2C828_ARAVE|nr:hypothetical protein AVEN_176428-1 [Araneus ventricosus]
MWPNGNLTNQLEASNPTSKPTTQKPPPTFASGVVKQNPQPKSSTATKKKSSVILLFPKESAKDRIVIDDLFRKEVSCQDIKIKSMKKIKGINASPSHANKRKKNTNSSTKSMERSPSHVHLLQTPTEKTPQCYLLRYPRKYRRSEVHKALRTYA